MNVKAYVVVYGGRSGRSYVWVLCEGKCAVCDALLGESEYVCGVCSG